jgi:hypothetical protein
MVCIGGRLLDDRGPRFGLIGSGMIVGGKGDKSGRGQFSRHGEDQQRMRARGRNTEPL